MMTLDILRRYAVARSLFAPTTLQGAIQRLGFVQVDPIRSPARAQDLTLRHRVKNYKAGDLERCYTSLDIEEDFFVNYGFMTRGLQTLMHPRKPKIVWDKHRMQQASEVLAFVRERGVVHPSDVDAEFAHGKTKNWFGGSTKVSTQLLDGMHYRGMLRVVERINGIRTYGLPKLESEGLMQAYSDLSPDAAMDALVDVIVQKYAPLPEQSLRELISLLRGGVPQWEGLRKLAMVRAKARLPSCVVSGATWYWPVGEQPQAKRYKVDDVVRLLAPFDPIVWDRRRFETFWGWAYRFEAYTPANKRLRGYYAMPLLWRDQVIGWGNISNKDGKLKVDLGYVSGSAPKDKAYKLALAEECERIRLFLN